MEGYQQENIKEIKQEIKEEIKEEKKEDFINITQTKEILPSNTTIVVVDSSLTSDIAISENVCTFKYTRNRYSEQPWYLCLSCNIYCCLICMEKCHEGHLLSEEENSDFFCDCGAENKSCLAIKDNSLS
jgi:hypothetical protein